MIRLMTTSDRDAVIALWLNAKMDYAIEGFDALLKRNPETCLVAQVDQHIIGVACGAFDGRRGIIQSVTVHENYRGRGIGRALVLQTIAVLKNVGARVIRLFIYEKEAERLLPFYEKLNLVPRDDVLYLALKETW